jgi:hypothetical protein
MGLKNSNFCDAKYTLLNGGYLERLASEALTHQVGWLHIETDFQPKNIQN